MHLNHAAALSDLPTSTVTAMETAGIRLPHHDVMKLLNIYHNGGTQQGQVAPLLTDSDTSVRDDAPGWAARLRAAEHQADAITSVNNHHIPAPLQTPAYAQALWRSHRKLMDTNQPDDDAFVHRPGDLPGRYRVFLDEAVLVQPYGGPAAMAEQIAHLERALTHGVDLRLITFDRPCTVLRHTRLRRHAPGPPGTVHARNALPGLPHLPRRPNSAGMALPHSPCP